MNIVSDFSRPSARDNVSGSYMASTTDQLSAKLNAFKSKFSDFVSQRRRHAGYGAHAVFCSSAFCFRFAVRWNTGDNLQSAMLGKILPRHV